MQRDEDEAWRAIVANYGERAAVDHEIDGDEHRDEHQDEHRDEAPERRGETGSVPATAPGDGAGEVEDLQRADEEPFVPPSPPPLPTPTRDRLAAWVGVFGAPALLLALLLFRVPVPSWLAYLLVAGFVGGFLYLVLQMPRGPRDPFDDGARL